MRRSRVAWALVVAAITTLGCGHGPTSQRPGSALDGGPANSAGSRTDAAAARREPFIAIERAEVGRRPQDILDAWLTASEPRVRQRAMRALARVVEPPIDAPADTALLRGLADEDVQVAGWAAYGLGWACKGKEDAHVKALAARAATFADADAGPAPGRDQLDPEGAILRAVGRCGGALAEGVLVGFLGSNARADEAEEAAYALGSLSGRHALGDEAMGALLDHASGEPSRPDVAAALFPIGRLERVPDAWTARVATAARAALGGSPAPNLAGFAVRALEKTGLFGISDLAAAASNAGLGVAARSDAARALGRLGLPGHEAASGVLARMVHDHPLVDAASPSSDTFNVLLAVVEAVGPEAPKGADGPLRAVAALRVAVRGGEDPPASAVLRIAMLRCAAAAALARGAYDAEVLAKCDPDPGGAAGQRARLAALVRKPIVGERRKAFRALAQSSHIAVREDALEAVAQHPELDDMGRTLLVQALGTTEPGVVATAAQAIVQHPERVLTLALSERRAALDPRAPPPTSHPAMDLPAEVRGALTRALVHAWREDAVETRTALLDAAVAVSLPEAQAAATRACNDSNVTVRDHAARALRALGAPSQVCALPSARVDAGAPPASSPAIELTHPTRVTFDVSGSKLAIVFEPELTPIAARRFVALARAGFYRGIVVHRVVPGYVVQFGDPAADGYGGSGELLPCETSPVPFDALDVGVALAGRDTGSSQVFVTLARYPKLDGDYARVGRAEGDWGAVAQGDVIDGVTVEE